MPETSKLPEDRTVLRSYEDWQKEGKPGLLCDFHTHSRWSDGALSLADVIRFYGENGFDAIALSDHLYVRNELLSRLGPKLFKNKLYAMFTKAECAQYLAEMQAMVRFAQEAYEMIVIPAVELSRDIFFRPSWGAHIVALDVKEYIDPNISPEEMLQAIHAQGGVSIAAHSFPKQIKNWRDIFLSGVRGTTYLTNHLDTCNALVDAWEIGSGKQPIASAIQYAQIAGSLIGNSDFHVRSDICGWKTILRCGKTKKEIAPHIQSFDILSNYRRISWFFQSKSLAEHFRSGLF